MRESSLTKARKTIRRLIESEIKRLEKKLAELKDLREGDYEYKLYIFECETLEMSRQLPHGDFLKVFQERSKQRAELIRKANRVKRKRYVKILEDEIELKFLISELKYELNWRYS